MGGNCSLVMSTRSSPTNYHWVWRLSEQWGGRAGAFSLRCEESYKTSDDNPEFWYVIYSEDVLDILGQPETFEVTVPQDV